MIRIQPFLSEYANDVVSVILTIQQTEFDIPITLAAQPDLLDVSGFYQRGNGNFWVALEDDQVIGTIAALDIGNRQMALRKMFVAASHRGARHGVAAALLQTLTDWCDRHGVQDIFLGTTAKFLAAHRFYEKHHFLEVTREALPKAFPVMTVDSKFYCLKLTRVSCWTENK